MAKVLDFARFRMGCHGLGVDVGRRSGVPHDQRLCCRCSLQEVDDERHILFFCAWQPLLDLRLARADALLQVESVKEFMATPTCSRVRYVSAAVKLARDFVAQQL